jgi:hypothetical protein
MSGKKTHTCKRPFSPPWCARSHQT